MNKYIYFFFQNGDKTAGSDLQSRVCRVSGKCFFRPETDFSLHPPLPVVVPFFINKTIAITTAECLFLLRGILKALPKIKHV